MGAAHDITGILLDWNRDPNAALERLTPLVYDELRRLASSSLRRERPGHTLQPTALVHEAYLRLAGQAPMAWKDRGHFYGVAARAMRLILVDSARRHYSQKRGSGKRVQLEGDIVYSQSKAQEFLDLNDSIEALKAWDGRKCSVVEMKYFGGMEREEVAEALGVSLSTVKRDLAIAEAFLRRQLGGV
ncbi:MAG TPA: ECF-type sigma factor [Bryobacteraceae bacterium]|nr:ECF-type sigma factor [Bryobacteraceae bacterium]